LGVRQFGTLGGGNHFVELQSDALDGLWATVHVGSRGMGAAIAAYHQIRAERLNGRKKFAWLSSNDSDGEAFWADLQWALSFAVENRRRILEQVRAAMSLCLNIDATATEWMDSPHNFIARETHGNQELFIHRKGAMSAPAGKRGLIPGSMGTASYIVEGLGNPEAYGSSSHGAGRILSRTEARRKITVKQLRREMGRVVYPNDSATLQAMVEEAPSAYRKINDVLAQQSDLVRPILRLEPLAVIKGD
jgi:tRNA-splicing ligase RtcB